MELEGRRSGVQNVLVSIFSAALIIASGTALRIGEPGPTTPTHASGTVANAVTVVATSPSDQFVGAVSGASSLFVGSLNGTVARITPASGHITGLVGLPDGNSAAHLAYYDGSLYVGTEWLYGAINQPPYHVYRIDPNTMRVTGEAAMQSHFANGFILAFNGFLWAGDGHCNLYKIDPSSMKVIGTVPGVAEDEMAFDGTNYWAECMSTVHVLKPASGLPFEIASGSLSYPDRPRGFFMVDSKLYSSGSHDFKIYSMSIWGDSVVFRNAAVKNEDSIPTRDTLQYGGLVYAYETGPRADSGQLPARIFEYSHGLRLLSTVVLPGPALCVDASQHTLFIFDGQLYFVTESSVGHITLTQNRASSITAGSPVQTVTSVSTVVPNSHNDYGVPLLNSVIRIGPAKSEVL